MHDAGWKAPGKTTTEGLVAIFGARRSSAVVEGWLLCCRLLCFRGNVVQEGSHEEKSK